jgi:hypothetical protein
MATFGLEIRRIKLKKLYSENLLQSLLLEAKALL